VPILCWAEFHSDAPGAARGIRAPRIPRLLTFSLAPARRWNCQDSPEATSPVLGRRTEVIAGTGAAKWRGDRAPAAGRVQVGDLSAAAPNSKFLSPIHYAVQTFASSIVFFTH